jgi:DNA-binding NtrC family response regulator
MKGARILLVDDEAAFVKTAAKRLSRLGFVVISANDGEGALRVIGEGEDFDVVVLDIRMPMLGGLDTLAALKKRDETLPVIILTGHGTFEIAVKAMRLGAFDYLTKPCELEVLVQRIQQAVEQRRTGS